MTTKIQYKIITPEEPKGSEQISSVKCFKNHSIKLSGKIVGEITKIENKRHLTGTFNLMYFTRMSTDQDGSHCNFIQVEIYGINDLSILAKGQSVEITGHLLQKRWVDDTGNNRSIFVISSDNIDVIMKDNPDFYCT